MDIILPIDTTLKVKTPPALVRGFLGGFRRKLDSGAVKGLMRKTIILRKLKVHFSFHKMLGVKLSQETLV